MTSPGPKGTVPDALDVSKPNVARAYDYLLGGKDNFAADRELASKLLAIYPGTRQMVRENRRFLVRALDYLLAQAISQYLDLGAGLPGWVTPARSTTGPGGYWPGSRSSHDQPASTPPGTLAALILEWGDAPEPPTSMCHR